MRRTSRFHLTNRLWPALVILVAIMQLIEPYRGWVILLVGLGGAWLSAFLWVRALAGGLTLEREMRYGWAQVGDRLEERFTLRNTSLIPALWVEVRDHSSLPDYHVSQVRSVGGRDKTWWRTSSVCTRRGTFQLGPTTLTTADPFGIFRLEISHMATIGILVTPPIVPLPRIDVAAGGRAGMGRPRRDAPEREVTAGGVREYLPGDSFRWIHWPTSARQDEFFVRLFDGIPAGDWWICVDMEEGVQVGEGWDSTEEHGVILAASLADQGLRMGKAVGLLANGKNPLWMPARMGEGQRWEILQALALLKPGPSPLGALLGRASRIARHQPSLIVITPAVEGDWLPALLPLAWAGVVPTVLVLDPATYGGAANPTRLLSILTDHGVVAHRITRDLLDLPEARPGTSGQWEWQVSPSGRAVPTRRPVDLSWKRLG